MTIVCKSKDSVGRAPYILCRFTNYSVFWSYLVWLSGLPGIAVLESRVPNITIYLPGIAISLPGQHTVSGNSNVSANWTKGIGPAYVRRVLEPQKRSRGQQSPYDVHSLLLYEVRRTEVGFWNRILHTPLTAD